MKYTQEKVNEVLKKHGLKTKDKYINRDAKMICSDEDGFLYSISLGSILVCNHPFKFSPQNPFSIENIKLYFKLNNIPVEPIEERYIGATQKMRWKCSCGNEFVTSLSEIERGRYYCDKCSTRKSHKYEVNYVQLIKEYCNSKNYTLLSNNILRARDYFDYVCNKHKSKGVQHSTYTSMVTNKHGCPYCASQSRGEGARVNEQNFKTNIEKLGLIYTGYEYSVDVPHPSGAKIFYICPKHKNKGKQITYYETTKNARVLCRYCLGKDRTKEDFQNELDELGLNFDITEYINYGSPIRVQCRKCGNEWSQIGVILRRTHKCPYCTKSEFETMVGNVLSDWNLNYIEQYTYPDCKDILKLPFDYFLTDFNVLIEVDGEGHYKQINRHKDDLEIDIEDFKKVQLHDEIKTRYCKKHDITLIRIPYWEKDNLEYFMFDKLVRANVIEKVTA